MTKTLDDMLLHTKSTSFKWHIKTHSTSLWHVPNASLWLKISTYKKTYIYEAKYFQNKAFESFKDSPWLNCVHIGLELVSPKNFHGSTSCTLNFSIGSPRRSYKIYIINKYEFKCFWLDKQVLQGSWNPIVRT